MDEHHWVVIVRRDQGDRLPKIRKLFPDAADVILDRRQGDRRASDTGVDRHRRHGDRRRPLSDHDARIWKTYGYHVAHPRGE